MVKLFERFRSSRRKQPAEIGSSLDRGPKGRPETPEIKSGGNGYHGKLVVVGRESEFPRDLVDYALDMAERLSYEIVALNTAPLSCETFKFFSSSRNKLCQDFQVLAEQNAAGFRDEVAGRGISFTHVVKFSDTDDALRELQGEIGDIDFIVSDLRETVAREEMSDAPRIASEIVVYAMVK